MNKKKLIIAIDGPVGSGKGTLAVALANKLNALYIYTGGMYRALTLACVRAGINVNDRDNVFALLKKTTISLKATELGTRVFLNGEDVSDEIFGQKVTKLVPFVSAISSVRKDMVKRQRKLITENKALIEGRDAATDIVPNADLKIYLTADIKTRTKRRLKQLEKKNIKTTFEKVLQEIKDRDRQDTQRTASPLRIAKDAVVIDTTSDTIDETVKKVVDKLKEKKLI